MTTPEMTPYQKARILRRARRSLNEQTWRTGSYYRNKRMCVMGAVARSAGFIDDSYNSLTNSGGDTNAAEKLIECSLATAVGEALELDAGRMWRPWAREGANYLSHVYTFNDERAGSVKDVHALLDKAVKNQLAKCTAFQRLKFRLLPW